MSFRVGKVCPVVTREATGGREILAFRHPLAGCQLVKGTIEAGETAIAAAVRELAEEAGIVASVSADMGRSSSIAEGQSWHFFAMETGILPENWVHRCADDGGHDFAFFWYALAETPDAGWHPIFVQALDYVRERS